MADVFISYARPDREIAQTLAESLTTRGYQVWWDAQLVGSDDFRDVILEELSLAKAVIVIWSPNSVRSKFVRDEAGRADHVDKLISTCKPGFDMQTLPLGFGGQHCHSVHDLEQTLKALTRIRIVPAEQKTVAEKKLIEREASDWERIKASKNREDFERYIRTYASGLYRAAAKIRLRQLAIADNKVVRGAGLLGYRALQVYAWTLVFSIIFALILGPLVGVFGSDKKVPESLVIVACAIAGFATYRSYRWFYGRSRNK